MFWKSKKNQDAVVFVDYEFWYLSIKSTYNLEPDIGAWQHALKERYPISEVFFFADITKSCIVNEVPRIQMAGVTLIESPPGRGHNDFILLDHLYLKANDKKSPKTFVLFVGNGHYEPAIKSLISQYGKQVLLYGIKGATSNYLKTLVNEYQLFPSDEDLFKIAQELIIREYNLLAKEKPNVTISFLGMTSLVSSKHNLPEGIVTSAMERMIGEGLLERRNCIEHIGAASRRVISPVWDKLIEVGLFTP